jgi:hypothetical protein
MHHGLYNSASTPWVMHCTTVQTVFISHGPWVVQQYIYPMGHALYNRYLSHGPWVVQQRIHPMGHALYNGSDSIHIPWPMGCTTVHLPHGSCIVQQIPTPCTMGCTTDTYPMAHGLCSKYLPHDPWVVQWYIYPMSHALYNGLDSVGIPCTMGCTTVHPPHGSCVVQWFRQCSYPMYHGLYSGTFIPCTMGCTTPHPPHGSCIVQQIPFPWPMGCATNTYPMAHGLYNSISTSWVMYCTVLLHLKDFYPCDLGKLNFSYPCPPIPPICFSCSISPMPWFFLPHLLTPHLPDTSHISEGPNHPSHLFHNNLPLLTPPLCSCPCPQPVNPIN